MTKGTTRTQSVIDRLRSMVLAREFPPGLHLTEASLSEHLAVSRTPVREALRVLANENLLLYSPNRGYVVPEVVLQDILDAYDVRGTLEAMACRLAAERGLDPVADADFDRIMQQSRQLLAGTTWSDADHAAWRDLNLAFHSRLLAVANNRHLTDTALRMRRQPRLRDARLEAVGSTFQAIYPVEQARRSHQEHEEILEAILQRQSTRAEALMREHVWRNRELLRKTLPHLPAETEATTR